MVTRDERAGREGFAGAISRRRFVGGALAALPASILAESCAAGDQPPADAVSLPAFRRPGDPDDTAALARAFATGRAVHAPAGRYSIGNGANGEIPHGARLFGDGRDKTVIARSYAAAAPFILHCDSKSPDPARNIAGLHVADLTFADDVATRGFEQFSYLVMLNGVSDVVFERVGFRGFRGDGLHLGSSTTAKTERHNQRIIVRDCVFDGVTANNRNGISIIDGDDVTIERCAFLNVTRRGDGTVGAGDPMNPLSGLSQPGAIDLEPNDDAFAVIRNIVIQHNRFVGGGGFAVAMLLRSNDFVTTPQQDIIVRDNVIEDRFGGFEAFGFAGDRASISRNGYRITIDGNRIARCAKPFVIDGMRSLRLHDNVFADCSDHAELGYRSTLAEIEVSGNTFARVGGAAPGFALWVRSSVGLRLTGNRFVDCGTLHGHDGIAIAFVSGATREMAIAGNSFTSPARRMAQAATRFREATIDATTVSIGANEVAVGPALRRALGLAP